MSGQITLHVNGEPQTCPESVSVPQLLQQLGYNPRMVAVEYNGEILHRQYWEQTQVQAGDRLEIVTIVGGGSQYGFLPSRGCGAKALKTIP